uniref:Uncharacterized protein n=1 Tax=Sphaerodactylus townsendi TaxID=933632 RepID=A0ACB8F342_9SAUR
MFQTPLTALPPVLWGGEAQAVRQMAENHPERQQRMIPGLWLNKDARIKGENSYKPCLPKRKFQQDVSLAGNKTQIGSMDGLKEQSLRFQTIESGRCRGGGSQKKVLKG